MRGEPVPIELKMVEFSEGPSSIPVYDYTILLPGMRLIGPALIVSSDTTILIDRDDRAKGR